VGVAYATCACQDYTYMTHFNVCQNVCCGIAYAAAGWQQGIHMKRTRSLPSGADVCLHRHHQGYQFKERSGPEPDTYPKPQVAWVYNGKNRLIISGMEALCVIPVLRIGTLVSP
jgi:hypothetical protein